jgi:hypothetical protein
MRLRTKQSLIMLVLCSIATGIAVFTTSGQTALAVQQPGPPRPKASCAAQRVLYTSDFKHPILSVKTVSPPAKNDLKISFRVKLVTRNEKRYWRNVSVYSATRIELRSTTDSVERVEAKMVDINEHRTIDCAPWNFK